MTETQDDNTWPAWRLLIFGFLGVAALVGGFGVWASMSELSGAIIATGEVEVEQNRQVVQHPDGGVVEEILVREGDEVAAGDVLMRLDATELVSELAVVEGQLFEVLARRARLEAERDGADGLVFDPLLAEASNPIAIELMEGQRSLFHARRETDRSQIEQLRRQKEQIADEIEGFLAQQQAAQDQLGITSEQLEGQEALLQRGLAQADRVFSLRRDVSALVGEAGQLTAAIAAAEGRITEIEIEILRIQTSRREEAITTLRDLQFNEIEISERRRQIINRLQRLEVKAPVSGIVYDLRIFGSQAVIRPAEQLLYIVPQDSALVINARVRPEDVDEVLVGQEVRVRLSAFSQRTTPELLGQVEFVSADAHTDEGSSNTYYRSRVQLLDGETAKLPEGRALLPGMPVDVFISTGERTPIDYLMKPLTDYFVRSFRES